MVGRKPAVHVVTTKRRYKDKVYRAHLLRRSYREDGKVKNETLANLSRLPEHVVELIRRSLRGEQLVGVDELFDVQASPQHGNVEAVLTAMKALGFADVIASRPTRERDLIVGMVAARILSPRSKLATTRWWGCTTLPRTLGLEDASEDDLYAAMDWLLEHQGSIEKKLAQRHLQQGGLVLYDLSSSYFTGTKCPLAAIGHSRDRRKGSLQVNYGLVTDTFGCPVSISVFPGNTGDPTTLQGEVDKVRDRFGIESMAIVGDRGMVTQKQIDALGEKKGVAWVTALRSTTIRDLVQRGALQLGLFDERNLFEIRHPDYPKERLVACRNLELADHRAHKRQALLEATSKKLEQIRRAAKSGRLRGKDKIGIRVGKVLNAYKVGKHFDLVIEGRSFSFAINAESVSAEALLHGLYVIRTSLPKTALKTEDVVRTYKRLCTVERAFRSLKTVDLHVRPIHHWNEDRVRAHIFVCMLAYYVQFHMQEAWRPLLFADEEAWIKKAPDPVAPAQRSASAINKVRTKLRADGQPVHSFRTLLASLGGIVCNICRRKGAGKDEPLIEMRTQPDRTQKTALELVGQIAV
jgi:hypothetical protein